MSYAAVIAFLGRLLAAFAVSMLAPAAVALRYDETAAAGVFTTTASVTLFIAIGMIFATQGTQRRVQRRGNFLVAIVAWPLLALFGAVPFFFLVADPGLTSTDAFFEAFSGLTTTGATVIPGLDAQGRGVLFWRAWLQWLGGLGTIVLAVSVLPMLGVGGMQVFRSAMPHGDHATLGARARRSALALSWVYAGLTLACAGALWAAGMPGFDAIGHALSTLSTGGFSTRDAALGAFDSASIEAVLIVFMLAGAMNFTLFWALLHGRPRVLRDDSESHALLAVAVLAALGAAYVLAGQSAIGVVDALRHGAFAVVSTFTTTGFVTGMAEPWPTALPILFLALMLIGGSSGSTAGGVKLMRVFLAIKQGRRELARLSHPHGVVRIQYGAQTVPEPAVQAMWSFFALFFAGFAVLAIVLAGLGLDARGAVTMALATVTNSGAGLSLVAGPEASYAALPGVTKWVVCLGMLLGRVEFVAMLALLMPMLWRR